MLRQAFLNLWYYFLNLTFKFIILNKPKHSSIAFQDELGYQESPEPCTEIPFNNPAHRKVS